MGATFSRLKNWTTEILTDSDLNAEIDNILNNLTPTGVDDYSSTAAQMRLQTSPGTLGAESLATSLAGELERLRFVIKRIIGTSTTYWYESPNTSLADLVAVLGTGLPANRIASGKTTGNSSQLNALIPSGTTASLTLTASSVDPFTYYIAGTQYSLTSSVTLTGLSLATAANSTVTLNKPDMTGNLQWAKSAGMYGTGIYVDGMNSGPAALVGNIAAFSATASGTTEYFIAYIESTMALTNAWRGCFFNQTPTAVQAVAFNDNDIMLLNKLAWIFASTNSSLAVTYNNPRVSGAQPLGPAIGDYWFDVATTAWKTYNGTSWALANATLIGMSVQSSTACVAARTFDSYKASSALQTLQLERISNIAVQAQNMGGKVNVFGKSIEYNNTRPTWDITVNLEAGVTETLNTTYYLYLTENGSAMMTDKSPLPRADLEGYYYPTETWRCVGFVNNDSATNMVVPAKTLRGMAYDKAFLTNPSAYRTGAGTTASSSDSLQLNGFANNNLLAVTGNNGAITTTSNVTINTLSLQPGLWLVWATLNGIYTATTTNQIFAGICLATQGLPIASYVGNTVIQTGATTGGTLGPVALVVTAASTNAELRARLFTGIADSMAITYTFTAIRMDKLIGGD